MTTITHGSLCGTCKEYVEQDVVCSTLKHNTAAGVIFSLHRCCSLCGCDVDVVIFRQATDSGLNSARTRRSRPSGRRRNEKGSEIKGTEGGWKDGEARGRGSGSEKENCKMGERVKIIRLQQESFYSNASSHECPCMSHCRCRNQNTQRTAFHRTGTNVAAPMRPLCMTGYISPCTCPRSQR